MDPSSSGYSSVAGFCEHDNEPVDCIKARDFLDQLSDCQFLRKCCAAQS
jgi:hypothetical protein